MQESLKIVSANNKPSEYASCLGEQLLLKKNQGEKQKLGQYFTPLPIASFMGTLAGNRKNNESIKILDPGCGTAVLSCALIEHMVISSNVREIELTCYENDKKVAPALYKSITYLANWLREKNIKFNAVIFEKDFVAENEDALSSLQSEKKLFDYIISNPPFFKVSQYGKENEIAPAISSEQPNIYFFFLLIAGKLLKESGALIFLLPRSFCCGGYYKELRNELLNYVKINCIYQFDISNGVFKDRGRLSDFVVVSGSKMKDDNVNYNINTSLIGFPDGNTVFNYNFLFSKKENLIYLPKSEEDVGTMEKINSYSGSLKKSDLEIRQGSILHSKVKKSVCLKKSRNSVPYFNAENIVTGKVNYVLLNDELVKHLIPNKNYVLFTRYNTHRNGLLTAAVHLKNKYQTDFILIGKQLNYISAKDMELSDEEVAKITDMLNSDIFNKYVKIINGNINITADMLMDIPLPQDLL